MYIVRSSQTNFVNIRGETKKIQNREQKNWKTKFLFEVGEKNFLEQRATLSVFLFCIFKCITHENLKPEFLNFLLSVNAFFTFRLK